MKKLTYILLFLIVINKTGAQNWAPVDCFYSNWQVRSMFVDSLHNKIILNFANLNYSCNTPFKGALAYNGNIFSSLDYGMNTHDPSPNTSGNAFSCTTFGNKTLFGGLFKSVGTQTLQATGLALWDDYKWDTFPKKAFKFNPNPNVSGKSIIGFHKAFGKLWIYGGFDSLGGIPGKNLYTFDGLNFQNVSIPVTTNYLIRKIITFKNKIIIAGGIWNFPYDEFDRIIAYDNSNWFSVGVGIKTSLGGVYDLAVYKDTLYIAGSFNKSDGNAGNNLMKWDGNTLIDAGFGGFYGWGGINQLLVFKNRLYAFGNFDNVADKKCFKAAYYENGKWTLNTDSIDNAINNAVIFNDTIYIAGGFSSINADTSLKYFVKLKCPDFDGCKKNNSVENFNIPFPNPFSNQLTINLPNETQTKITVVNSLGQIISKQILFAKSTINTSTWPTGIYFIYINNNYINKTYKVVKE